MMLRGLPRTPSMTTTTTSTTATPFSRRNQLFVDENGIDQNIKGVTAKTPLTFGKLGGGTDQKLQQQSGRQRRVALGDISNRKPAVGILKEANNNNNNVIAKSTTKKKKNATILLPNTNNTSATRNATQKQPTKRVNFLASLQEPSLETRPRVLFTVPTPVPKGHFLGKEILDDEVDNDVDDDGKELFPLEDVERPAGRLWSAEEHGFFGENDDPRDDISLDEGSRHFMADLRKFMQEARVEGLQNEILRQEAAAQQFEEQRLSLILQEQWYSDLSALEWSDPKDIWDELVDLNLDDDDDDEIARVSLFVSDISF